jgi:spermidine/putrescine transport system permease protein
MRKSIVRPLILLAALVFMYAPILILALYSFTDATQIGAIRGFTMKNYVTLFTTEELRNMIIGTVLLALVAAFIATILGTLGAIGAFYSKKRSASAIATMNRIPVINADVVTGFSLCILLVVVFGVSKDTYIPLLIGHVVLCAPFVYLSVMPKLKQMDNNIYEAALDLGATPMKALLNVVIPQIMPGIVSGFLLSLTMSMDDFVISLFTSGAVVSTLSLEIYSMTKRGITPEINALSTIIFLIVLTVLIITNVRRPKTDGNSRKA